MHEKSEPEYSIMSSDVTPFQSGYIDRRFGNWEKGSGSSRLDPIPNLPSKQRKFLYLSQTEIDNIRVSIKTHWMNNIVKTIGQDIPIDCYNSLKEFKAVEKHAEKYTIKNVTMLNGDFAKWILSKNFNYPSNFTLISKGQSSITTIMGGGYTKIFRKTKKNKKYKKSSKRIKSKKCLK
jgi:hypothetical protein